MPEADPQRPPDDVLSHDQRRARRPKGARRLVRVRGAPGGGVAAGVAAFVGANPRHVRWAFVLGTLLTIGIAAAVYILLWLLLPTEDAPER